MAHYLTPPFEKGGIGGIYKGVMLKNPPKSTFQKGDLKESGLFYEYLPLSLLRCTLGID